jgi:hypothetical protein
MCCPHLAPAQAVREALLVVRGVLRRVEQQAQRPAGRAGRIPVGQRESRRVGSKAHDLSSQRRGWVELWRRRQSYAHCVPRHRSHVTYRLSSMLSGWMGCGGAQPRCAWPPALPCAVSWWATEPAGPCSSAGGRSWARKRWAWKRQCRLSSTCRGDDEAEVARHWARGGRDVWLSWWE